MHPEPTCIAPPEAERVERPRTVLVAEDSDDFREMLTAFLAGQGYGVVAAKDGSETITAALLHRPALVLMDIGLPGIDGLSAAREIRKTITSGETPILVVSAYDSVEFRAEAVEAGCVGYMVKPIDPAALLKTIHLLLDPDGE